MMMKKEQWIEDVLKTAKEIGLVPSKPYLATRIESRLQQRPSTLSLRWALVSVAAMLLLVFVNISAWRHSNEVRGVSGAQQVLQ